MKKIVILPALLTLGNAAFGFSAIALIIDGAFKGGTEASPHIPLINLWLAGLFVFCAMVCDALDGVVARLVGGATKFGAYLDSLADIISFGVAPTLLVKAILEYCFHLFPGEPVSPLWWSRLVWIITGVYCLCAILRLARYDAENTGDSSAVNYFEGLPMPGAAGVPASLAMLYAGHENLQAVLPYIMFGAVPLLGALMVSRLPFPHFVNKVLLSRHSFKYVLVFAIAVVVVVAGGVYDYALAAGFAAYTLAVGPLLALRRNTGGGRPRYVPPTRIRTGEN